MSSKQAVTFYCYRLDIGCGLIDVLCFLERCFQTRTSSWQSSDIAKHRYLCKLDSTINVYSVELHELTGKRFILLK
jgi:hypothetical protein